MGMPLPTKAQKKEARPTALTFNDNGIIRVNVTNGTYNFINEEDWGNTKAAVLIDGSTALTFNDDGIIRVNVTDGTYNFINEEDWSNTKAAVLIDGSTAL